ncbi:hypothetical protein N1851_020694 [Merluccius polli]|uniref:Uncharacterized protein n=1 Tax=Merluccius polli TaxID=89951 RepID=A0AA47MKD5_MERPO|nr:hypothetical protein N1851_020694 [Merluccius polli]
MLHNQHRDGPILQSCSLQQSGPSNEGSSTALGPSVCHLPPRLLQLAPGWTPCLKPLQCIQTAAARPVFNLQKFSHLTPLFRDLHWLPVAARIRFKTMVLAYKSVNDSAPTYLQGLVRPHAPAHALRSTTSADRSVPPSL